LKLYFLKIIEIQIIFLNLKYYLKLRINKMNIKQINKQQKVQELSVMNYNMLP